MSSIRCTRCGKEGLPPEFIPYKGKLKEMIETRVCGGCFEEWKKASVMIINEKKLTTFLPEHQKIIEDHMKEFLGLKT